MKERERTHQRGPGVLKKTHRPDKKEKIDLDMMALDTINPEEVGKYEGLSTYEKVWGDYALDHSINTPHYFWVGLFLESVSRRQEKVMEILGTMCGEFLEDWT